jgi:hypothetical protein
LLGIATSILALVVGGDPRLLLIRESFFTGGCSTSGAISWRERIRRDARPSTPVGKIFTFDTRIAW